jgi:L-methionine (R)-S-oxide reductase
MENSNNFIYQLLDISSLLEVQTDLEKGLREVATLTAQVLKTRRCSIMLLTEAENSAKSGSYLKLFTHYGNLPSSAYQEMTPLNEGIAGHVAATGEALLIKNIARSQFAEVARYLEEANKSLMSVPIAFADRIIGVINVSNALEKDYFDESDLENLKIFALFVGKSVHIAQLQNILRSKFLEMAVMREISEDLLSENLAIAPNPSKLAKIAAKSFYQELTKAGFNTNQVIEAATEVLDLLQRNINRHKERRSRDGE